jgi:hypothetical protein
MSDTAIQTVAFVALVLAFLLDEEEIDDDVEEER